MREYLDLLIEQYKSANGIKNFDINDGECILDLFEWINDMQMVGRRYSSFINYMGVNPNNFSSSIEIGKGVFDSIVLDSDVVMLTPYDINIYKESLIKGNLEISGGIPVVRREGLKPNQLEIVDTKIIRRFITHNPYNEGYIKNWEQLHNVGVNITVGIFGNCSDKDRVSKINQLKSLRDKLNNGEYVEEYDTDKGNYFYAISSHRRIKTR